LYTGENEVYIIKKHLLSTSSLNEVKLLYILDHANIIKIKDWKSYNNFLYITQPYYENGDMLDAIYKWKKKLELFKTLFQLTDVVKYLHSKNIAHMDINVENILLDGDNNIVLMDLKNSTKISEYKGDIVGNPTYHPPERKNIDPIKKDVWGIGFVIYEMVFSTSELNYDDIRACACKELKNILLNTLEQDSSKRWNIDKLYASLTLHASTC
jgi:serine/threonine protein kinase